MNSKVLKRLNKSLNFMYSTDIYDYINLLWNKIQSYLIRIRSKHQRCKAKKTTTNIFQDIKFNHCQVCKH
jgi:hypothetical protein